MEVSVTLYSIGIYLSSDEFYTLIFIKKTKHVHVHDKLAIAAIGLNLFSWRYSPFAMQLNILPSESADICAELHTKKAQ